MRQPGPKDDMAAGVYKMQKRQNMWLWRGQTGRHLVTGSVHMPGVQERRPVTPDRASPLIL